jgi:hypothetical protein
MIGIEQWYYLENAETLRLPGVMVITISEKLANIIYNPT